MRRRIREHLAHRKRRSVEGETKDRLFAALTERYPFPVPESLVQEQIDARLERGLRALAAQGMDPEQMRKLDFARLRAAQRDSAIAEVKTSVLLDRIARSRKYYRQRRGIGKRIATGSTAVPRAPGYPKGAIDAGRRYG